MYTVQGLLYLQSLKVRESIDETSFTNDTNCIFT